MSFINFIPFPKKKYSIIYADPPWRYNDKGCNGNCEAHYPTLSIKDLCQLPVAEICNKDAILFLWTTYPMLKEAMQLIDAWDFKYKTIAFQWIKTNKKSIGFFYGLGRWTRGNTEPCLLATRGKPKRINNSISQLVVSPIERHSKKPDIVRDLIVDLVGDLPRIELFARKTLNSWDAWGDEV